MEVPPALCFPESQTQSTLHAQEDPTVHKELMAQIYLDGADLRAQNVPVKRHALVCAVTRALPLYAPRSETAMATWFSRPREKTFGGTAAALANVRAAGSNRCKNIVLCAT